MYEAETYGERIADLYDLIETANLDTPAASDRLRELSGGGRVLELGVGTGRLALPLVEAGLEVHGVEASQAMIDKLRAKPGGDQVHVTKADFQDARCDGEFALIFAAFDTLYALCDQEAQRQCVANMAGKLSRDGVFVVEGTLPDADKLAKREHISVRYVDDRLLVLDAARYDPALQTIVGQYLIISNGAMRMCPVQVRYIWPSELDLMAQMAGLSLRQRWSSWRGEPFDAASRRYISLYGRA